MAVADLSTPASTAVSPSVGAAGAAAATWYRSTLTDAPVYPELTHELDVDVAIVGGGHTGVATALELSERGTSVALLESGRIKLETPLYHGGALNHHNVHLNSLGLCVGEAAAAAELSAQIFESSEVLRIDEAQTGHPAVVHTRAGCVRADTVILAGNAYHRLRQPDFRGRMFPAVLGNLTTAPLERDTLDAINPDRLAVYDSRMVLDYYRITEDNRLLFGGGTNYSGRDLANVAAKLRPRLERTFPRLKGVAIEFAWTGLAGIVPNRIPLVGRLKGGLIYAQGYSLAVGSDHAKSMIQKLKTGW